MVDQPTHSTPILVLETVNDPRRAGIRARPRVPAVQASSSQDRHLHHGPAGVPIVARGAVDVPDETLGVAEGVRIPALAGVVPVRELAEGVPDRGLAEGGAAVLAGAVEACEL
jgi:hypothetical protein